MNSEGVSFTEFPDAARRQSGSRLGIHVALARFTSGALSQSPAKATMEVV
jgi:hypothetical protein